MTYLIHTPAELDALAAADPNTVVSFVDNLGITQPESVTTLAMVDPWDQWPVTVHANRVIAGSVEEKATALDALPQWSIVRVREGDEDPMTYEKISGLLPWHETGMRTPVSSEHIARHNLPVVVVLEGGAQ